MSSAPSPLIAFLPSSEMLGRSRHMRWRTLSRKLGLKVLGNFQAKFLDDFGITGEAPRIEFRNNVIRESVSTFAITFGRHNCRDGLKDASPRFPRNLLIHSIVNSGTERATEDEQSNQGDQHETSCLNDVAL